ncbi:hypothetical protein KY330_04215 [Candidatus Woesearchaeota archaeon]|nr:hypothetical protein [Candidatus Woesearchaeota archaeon]
MKRCENRHCRNNRGGFCGLNRANDENVYCLLTEDQWIKIREYQEERFKKGLIKKDRNCVHTDCLNNIKGYCCLISEVNLLQFLGEKQIDKLF